MIRAIIRRKCKNAYFICNTNNDHLSFSSITNIPHTEMWERELRVEFDSSEYVEHQEIMTDNQLMNILGGRATVDKKL